MQTLISGIKTALEAVNPIDLLGSTGDVCARYDLQDIATMFQDDVGAVPVYQPGTGQPDPPVALILDQSGNGNHARQTDPARRARLSGRYNLKTASGDVTNGTWAKQGLTASVPNVLMETATTGYHAVLSGAVVYGTGAFSWSIRIKPAGRDRVSLYFGGGPGVSGIVFDLRGEGSVAQRIVSGGIDCIYRTSIFREPDGWYVLNMTGVRLGYDNANCIIALHATDAPVPVAAPSYTGDPAKGVLLDWQDIRIASDIDTYPPRYQRVVDAATYDTTGFPLYLRPDRVDDQFALTVPAGGISGSLVVGGDGAASVTPVDLPEGAYLYPAVPASGPTAIRHWILFSRPLTDYEQYAVTVWMDNGVLLRTDCYLCVDPAALPPTSGRPCLGIRPAGSERSEVSVSGCRWEVLHTVELVATVAMAATDQATALDAAYDLLDAATTTLNHNLSVRAGVVAALVGGDTAPEFVRDDAGRWNVRVIRTMTYQIEEML